jgi:tRNA pseudouridine38-40 synthase
MPYRYFIKLSYNGTDFCGWQVQPNANTVQQELENALDLIIHHKSGITGCGRTDSGVHASNYFAHFDVEEPIKNPINLVFKLNRFLPPTIAIHNIIPVKAGSHSRFSALMREYTYTIITQKDPFLYPNAYLFTTDLDIESMNSGAELLLKSTDFECFSKVKTQVANFRCKLVSAEWSKNQHILKFTIRSDRFLRNMVRSIVGTLLDVGMHKIGIEDLQSILISQDRRRAGRSVPAKGLMLTDIQYPADIYIDKPEWFSEDCLEKIISNDKADSQFHKDSSNETNE